MSSAAEPLISDSSGSSSSSSSSNSNSSSMEMDPMVRDRKELELSSLSASVPLFLLHLFVVLPVWATVLVPCAAIYQAGLYCVNCVAPGGKKASTTRPGTAPASSDTESPAIPPADYGSASAPAPTAAKSLPRKYDVMLYGATGFTGKLAADYLARQYGATGGFTWALAGRRRAALEEVRDQITASHGAALGGVPILVADSADRAALEALVTSAKVRPSPTSPSPHFPPP